MSGFEPTHYQGFPTCCYACGHSATGAGVGDFKRDPRFLCDECVKLADAIGARNLDAFEVAAIVDAGNDAGSYLDGLGVTDLTELQPEQYRQFCKRLIQSFAASIRRQVAEGFK